MSVSVFDYREYKRYLEAWCDGQPKGGRGTRSALAQAANCQTAYVSRVLGGDAHFSLEQADQINRFVGHSKGEAHFFMLLVQLARAGTKSLESYVSEQIDAVLEKRLQLKERLKIERVFAAEHQPLYFSSWHYAAVHLSLTVPRLRTKEAISSYWGLPLSRVAEVLAFLVSTGLAEEDKGRYTTGTARMHLTADSPMISKHHSNWRIQALQSLDDMRPQDLHYSSAVSIAQADVLRIREEIVRAIDSAKALIRDSKEEVLYSFNVDFFELPDRGRPRG